MLFLDNFTQLQGLTKVGGPLTKEDSSPGGGGCEWLTAI